MTNPKNLNEQNNEQTWNVDHELFARTHPNVPAELHHRPLSFQKKIYQNQVKASNGAKNGNVNSSASH